MACSHETREQFWVEGDPEYGEQGRWEERVQSTTVDIDTGRYRCTQCGEVMYYTGRWRDHWEKGTPL